MSRDKKETYMSPEAEVLDVSQEGLICASESPGAKVLNPWENFTENDTWYE